MKKDKKNWFKIQFKKHPFVWSGGTFLFIAISIATYYGEDTLISTYFLGFGVIIFYTWLLIYSPYRFFKFIRDKRPFDEKKNINSFLIWVLLFFLMTVPTFMFSYFMKMGGLN